MRTASFFVPLMFMTIGCDRAPAPPVTPAAPSAASTDPAPNPAPSPAPTPTVAAEEPPAAPAADVVNAERPNPAGIPAVAHDVPTAGPMAQGSLFALDLELETSSGKKKNLKDFGNKPLVVSMFYSHCAYGCPTLINDIQRIDRALTPEAHKNARYLLVTFDDQVDDPATLAKVVERHELDDRWTLARASADGTRELAAALGIKFRRKPDGNYNHSALITLLNKEGAPAARIDGLRQDATDFTAVLASLLK